MTSLPALEVEIKDACRAWVKSGKKLVRGSSLGHHCGCALDALANVRDESGDWRTLHRHRDISGLVGEFTRGFDYGPGEHDNPPARQLGARIAAWAEREGLLS